MPTQFLDLDAVAPKVDFSLKLNGVDHKLEEPSVEVFITNMQDIEKLALEASPREELELSIKMIMRSFPTIKEEELRALKLSQLQAIGDFARQASGQDASKEAAKDEKDAEGNAEAAS